MHALHNASGPGRKTLENSDFQTGSVTPSERFRQWHTDGRPGDIFGVLLDGRLSRSLKNMEVFFTAEQEAQLAQMATKAGTNPAHLVKDAALRLLEEGNDSRPPLRNYRFGDLEQ